MARKSSYGNDGLVLEKQNEKSIKREYIIELISAINSEREFTDVERKQLTITDVLYSSVQQK